MNIDDGFNAMMKSKRSREPIKRLGLAKIMSYSRPASLKNVAIRIDYEDIDGISSKRWVTIKSITKHRGSPPTMDSYCWVRRQNRTFRIDRIAEVAGCDGEVIDGQEFFKGFGLSVDSSDYETPKNNSRNNNFSGVPIPHSVSIPQETLDRCQRHAEERRQGTRQTSSTPTLRSGFESFSKSIPDKNAYKKVNSHGYSKRLVLSAIAVWTIIIILIALLS